MSSNAEKSKKPNSFPTGLEDKANNYEWKQFDMYQEQNMGELSSELSEKPTNELRTNKANAKKKLKKYSEIEEYQKALMQLRSQPKQFHKPFEKQLLNLSSMQAIKMLKEAVEKDKDFTGALRKMGCKTRMRVRNKTAAKELFEVMLDYIQLGEIPIWMHERHKELLQKDDSKFDHYMRMEEKDFD